MFADDTNIFYSHKDPNFLNTIVNTELDKLSSWFQANRLSINVKKSNFVIFKSAQNRQNLDFSFFTYNNQIIIDRVEEVVFLGVILDQNLNWKSHIHNVARKISKSLGIIYKASFCLNEASLRTLYFSLVYPYLCYCVGVWGSTYPSNLKRVVTLQKRAIRIISKSKFDAHTDPLFKELKMLKLDSIIRFHICKLMFLYRHGLLPESFDNMFPLNNEIHSYNTSRSCFSLPYCRTNIGKFSIRYQGPKLFNSVNEDIRNSSSVSLFSSRLKSFLLA